MDGDHAKIRFLQTHRPGILYSRGDQEDRSVTVIARVPFHRGEEIEDPRSEVRCSSTRCLLFPCFPEIVVKHEDKHEVINSNREVDKKAPKASLDTTLFQRGDTLYKITEGIN